MPYTWLPGLQQVEAIPTDLFATSEAEVTRTLGAPTPDAPQTVAVPVSGPPVEPVLPVASKRAAAAPVHASEWDEAFSSAASEPEELTALEPARASQPDVPVTSTAAVAKPAGTILDTSHRGFGGARGPTSDYRVVLERRIAGEIGRRELNSLNAIVHGFREVPGMISAQGSAMDWLVNDSRSRRLFHAKVVSRAGVTLLHVEEDLSEGSTPRYVAIAGSGVLLSLTAVVFGLLARLQPIQMTGCLLPLLIAFGVANRSFRSRIMRRLDAAQRLFERLSHHVSRTAAVE
jgi:hypothetical protein